MHYPSPEHILKVNHAGERGAINIYKGQIFISRLFYPDIADELRDMMEHEQAHFKIFESLRRKRNWRHCNALPLWGLGGLTLGLFTALFGKAGVWICTYCVERTVFSHLTDQIDYLEDRDEALKAAVQAIITDEEDHKDHAANQINQNTLRFKILDPIITFSTELAIKLSLKL